MIGCHIGRIFQLTVAGGSYQEGLTSMVHGIPPGMLLTEQEIYGDLLLRKPGADELSSPRKEPDLPVIYSGTNAADTIEGAILIRIAASPCAYWSMAMPGSSSPARNSSDAPPPVETWLLLS